MWGLAGGSVWSPWKGWGEFCPCYFPAPFPCYLIQWGEGKWKTATLTPWTPEPWKSRSSSQTSPWSIGEPRDCCALHDTAKAYVGGAPPPLPHSWICHCLAWVIKLQAAVSNRAKLWKIGYKAKKNTWETELFQTVIMVRKVILYNWHQIAQQVWYTCIFIPILYAQ